eukprot:Rhum_TRINITY_DN14247_c13_g2::Rhum_TRINITY_DN14247_c13_g2_i1::g.77128::m.77128
MASLSSHSSRLHYFSSPVLSPPPQHTHAPQPKNKVTVSNITNTRGDFSGRVGWGVDNRSQDTWTQTGAFDKVMQGDGSRGSVGISAKKTHAGRLDNLGANFVVEERRGTCMSYEEVITELFLCCFCCFSCFFPQSGRGKREKELVGGGLVRQLNVKDAVRHLLGPHAQPRHDTRPGHEQHRPEAQERPAEDAELVRRLAGVLVVLPGVGGHEEDSGSRVRHHAVDGQVREGERRLVEEAAHLVAVQHHHVEQRDAVACVEEADARKVRPVGAGVLVDERGEGLHVEQEGCHGLDEGARQRHLRDVRHGAACKADQPRVEHQEAVEPRAAGHEADGVHKRRVAPEIPLLNQDELGRQRGACPQEDPAEVQHLKAPRHDVGRPAASVELVHKKSIVLRVHVDVIDGHCVCVCLAAAVSLQ